MAKEKTEKRKPKKELAYELFDQGFGPSDPEVKHIISSSGSRRNYFSSWRKDRGLQQYTIGEIIAERSSEDLEEAKRKFEEQKGKQTLPAPSRVISQKRIKIGDIEIPFDDWGYSSTFKMLVVAATYEEVCKSEKEGGWGFIGPVGDFCAECVLLFRRLFDFDRMKEEEYGRVAVLPEIKEEGDEREEPEG